MKTRSKFSMKISRALRGAAVVAIAALGVMSHFASSSAQTAEAPKKTAETYYFLVFSNPVPGTEVEYNKWYTEQHQLDVVSVPGFVSAQRYVFSENQLRMSKPLPKYLVSYKIVTDDLRSVFQEVRRRLDTGETKMSPTFDGKTSVGVTYKAIQPVVYHKGDNPKISGKAQTFAQIVFSNPTPGEEDEYNRWYGQRHLFEVLSAPGFVNAQRFVLSDLQFSAPAQWPYKYLATYEIVTDDWPARILDYKRTAQTQTASTAMGTNAGYTYVTLGPMIDGDKVRAGRAKMKLKASK